jgi:outer membrane protein assembly factor BamB
MAFFCDAENISVCDVATGKTEILWTAESRGYDVVNSNLSYYDGLIYFTALSAAREELVPEDPDYYANMTTTSTYLFSLDPKTKKSTLITEEPINSYYIEDDRIYYIPKALGTIQFGDRIMPRFSANEVYSFDLNGRNKEKVCSFDGIFVYDILYMNDSIICVQDYYGENFSTSYCVIDRLTGEVTRVTRVVRAMRE